MPTAPNSITVSALDIVSAAMRELGILAANEQPSAADGEWGLQKTQRLLDRYNARQPMIYNVDFTLFTMLPNHQPHTIGPGADFDVSQRPVKIVSAATVLVQSTANVDVPLNIRDDQWWADQRVKNLHSTYPTDLYYSPSWEVQDDGSQWGQIFFWPIPTQTNGMRLQLPTTLAQLKSLADPFSMPPAYWDAIVYPLAISLCPSFGLTAGSDLLRLGAQSLKAIETNNVASPRGSTADAGMPGVGRRGDFNYYSGLPNSF